MTARRGCSHCETGRPVHTVASDAGRVRLCIKCLLAWFPGRDERWLRRWLRRYRARRRALRAARTAPEPDRLAL